MKKHYQMWEKLGLDLEKHAQFLKPLPGLYGDLFPVIQLESDFSDSDSGQLNTRIQAFLEMI